MSFHWCAFQFEQIDNFLTGIEFWISVIASHFFLVHQKPFILQSLHPIIQSNHVAITMEWVSTKINFLACIGEDLINLIQGAVFQVSDFVITKINVAKFPQALKRETDIHQLVVSEVNVEKLRKITKHFIIFDLPNLILF